MGDYRLVQVGVSSDFMRILQGTELPACENGRKTGRVVWKKSRRVHEKEAERLRRKHLAEETVLRQSFLREIVTDIDRSSFYCEETMPFLRGWQFQGYTEEEWVQHMMRYISLHHFTFLGRVHFMPRLLLPYVKRMKSMRWILPMRLYGEAEREIVEDICEEYGLLVEVQLLECEEDYRRLRLTGLQPQMIVDFSGAEKISAADLPEGSIWLDMEACEAKRTRIEERDQKILYFSLKKEWKQPQKALFYLDTAHKNGYNT